MCSIFTLTMSFINVVYQFKTLFRSIEKLTKRWVHLRNGIEYTELCALVNKPSGASAGASDLKY